MIAAPAASIVALAAGALRETRGGKESTDGRARRHILLVRRPRGHLAIAAALVGHSLEAAVDACPGSAADVAACSWW